MLTWDIIVDIQGEGSGSLFGSEFNYIMTTTNVLSLKKKDPFCREGQGQWYKMGGLKAPDCYKMICHAKGRYSFSSEDECKRRVHYDSLENEGPPLQNKGGPTP